MQSLMKIQSLMILSIINDAINNCFLLQYTPARCYVLVLVIIEKFLRIAMFKNISNDSILLYCSL